MQSIYISSMVHLVYPAEVMQYRSNYIFHAFFNERLEHFRCTFNFLLYPYCFFDMASKNKACRIKKLSINLHHG